MVFILIIIIFIITRMYLLTNFITMLMIPTSTFPFQVPCSEDTIAHAQLNFTYENGVQFEIKSWQSFRLSSFILSADIVSVIVDQNFTMNAIGTALESV